MSLFVLVIVPRRRRGDDDQSADSLVFYRLSFIIHGSRWKVTRESGSFMFGQATNAPTTSYASSNHLTGREVEAKFGGSKTHDGVITTSQPPQIPPRIPPRRMQAAADSGSSAQKLWISSLTWHQRGMNGQRTMEPDLAGSDRARPVSPGGDEAREPVIWPRRHPLPPPWIPLGSPTHGARRGPADMGLDMGLDMGIMELSDRLDRMSIMVMTRSHSAHSPNSATNATPRFHLLSALAIQPLRRHPGALPVSFPGRSTGPRRGFIWHEAVARMDNDKTGGDAITSKLQADATETSQDGAKDHQDTPATHTHFANPVASHPRLLWRMVDVPALPFRAWRRLRFGSWQPDMNQAIVHHRTRSEIQPTILTLLDVLYNSLILTNTAPYLPVASLLNLAATSRDFRYLLYQTPGVFRHLDLSHVKTAQFNIAKAERGDVWHNVQLDEILTEDDFYSGPLRGIFSSLRRRSLLQDVQTLILDGLSVTADMCHEIINDPSYNVRILSIRDAKNLNQGKLRGALTYACRNTRPEGSPKLKALYVFGSQDAATVALATVSATQKSIGAGWNHKSHKALVSSLQTEEDLWWSKKGRIIARPVADDWASCLLACEGIISFDAVLCKGPRHRNSPMYGKTAVQADCGAAVATYAVGGCASCGKAPEGLTRTHSHTPASLPLLTPPPLLGSSIRAATTPRSLSESFVPRCTDCLRERYCACCNKWWCESCYIPGQGLQDGGITIVEYDGSWNSLENYETEFKPAKTKESIVTWMTRDHRNQLFSWFSNPENVCIVPCHNDASRGEEQSSGCSNVSEVANDNFDTGKIIQELLGVRHQL
ncbi:hypothetical protein G7046_g5023 [Stylonectria norvegica]|nr:hypothetical protein G7046_g5023 [Stylonectria norvegica]